MGLLETGDYPIEVIQKIKNRLEDNFSERVTVKYYAGEFFSEETVKKLARKLAVQPALLIHLPSLDNFTTETEYDPDTSEDLIQFNIFCAATNRKGEIEQQLEALKVANEVRVLLKGYVVEPDNREEYAEEGIAFESIDIEHSIPDMTVYTANFSYKTDYNHNA